MPRVRPSPERLPVGRTARMRWWPDAMVAGCDGGRLRWWSMRSGPCPRSAGGARPAVRRDALEVFKLSDSAPTDSGAPRLDRIRDPRDLRALPLPWPGHMNLLVTTPQGDHYGASTRPEDTYLYMTGDMDEPAVAPRAHVPLQ